jgi:hypothetical protein
MSRARSVSSLVGIVAIALSLSGCSLLPGSAHPATVAPDSGPESGQCWNATTTHAAAWTDWEGGSAVPCGSSHTLYTYHVGTVSGESEDTWAAPGDPTELSPTVQAKAAEACGLTKVLPHLKWNQQLVSGYFFVPTETQWRAGARWIRCDLGVLATGTTFGNESFTALPTRISTLVDAITSDPLRFELCVNSPTPVSVAGPLDDPNATLADCKDNPQWKLAIHGSFPDAAGSPFPDSAASNAASSKLCLLGVKSDDEVWMAYLPTKAGWAAGDREIDCWIGQKSADTGSGGTV